MGKVGGVVDGLMRGDDNRKKIKGERKKVEMGKREKKGYYCTFTYIVKRKYKRNSNYLQDHINLPILRDVKETNALVHMW